jgi:hypothetical protein|tara:strand:+ start:2554 stop:2799 length:246 start_codon:yes stop_codon:yes gene_type:complete
MLNKKELYEIVSVAIEPERPIDEESSEDNTPEWDSLGQLSILASLDDRTSGATSNLEGISEADSIIKLLDIISSNNLLSED